MGYPLPHETALKGPFAPMRFEATVEECIVSQGEIPRDLSGGYYRCGPTWKRPTKQGSNALVSMDGMVQAIVFDNGRADFRNRWVRTPKYLLEEKHRRGMFAWTDGAFGDWRDFAYGDVQRDSFNCHTPQGTSNINVFPFAGQGDGYIIVPVSWWADKRGEYLIFDTDDITQGPVCTIELPFALGWTPHGHWMDFR
jgi:carotenoid cleavage dioxygenase